MGTAVGGRHCPLRTAAGRIDRRQLPQVVNIPIAAAAIAAVATQPSNISRGVSVNCSITFRREATTPAARCR